MYVIFRGQNIRFNTAKGCVSRLRVRQSNTTVNTASRSTSHAIFPRDALSWKAPVPASPVPHTQCNAAV